MASRIESYSYREDLIPIKEFMGVSILMCQADGRFIFQREDAGGYFGTGRWVAKRTLAEIEKEISAGMKAVKAIRFNTRTNVSVVDVVKPEKSDATIDRCRWRLKNGVITDYYDPHMYLFDQALYDEAVALANECNEFASAVDKFYQECEERRKEIMGRMTKLTLEEFLKAQAADVGIDVGDADGDLLGDG